MDLITQLLARLFDNGSVLTRRKGVIASLLTALLSVGAIVTDLADVGEGLKNIFTHQGAIERRLEQLIAEVDADKAGAFIFQDGERRIVADVAQSGALPISNSNRQVSLSVPPFDDLLAKNRAGKCWIYKYPKDGVNKNVLDDGMDRSRNRTIISCPSRYNGALKGTVGAGWGRYLSKQEVEKKSAAIEQAAEDIGGLL